MTLINARTLAARQRATDAARCAERPTLLAIRHARMAASALGFLRGSAPLFYSILEEHPTLGEGPDGNGWIAGDLHVENFGAFRVDAMHIEAAGGETVFDLNDLDDAIVAPLRLDVLRLSTSAVLGARLVGLDGAATLSAVAGLLEAHAAALAGAPAPPFPEVVATHLKRASERTREHLLDRRTELVNGTRRFVRGERYLTLAPQLVDEARAAFNAFVASLPPSSTPRPPDAFLIDDIALRIAGTGSLGCLRVAVLTRGRGGKHGGWIFDMKEEGTPAASILVGEPTPPRPPAERVVAAGRALLRVPPRMAGTTTLAGRSMLVRRLAPQEDKVSFEAIARPENVAPILATVGTLAGAAHRRGAATTPPPFDAAARVALLEQAVELAAIHEAVYLAYCAP